MKTIDLLVETIAQRVTHQVDQKLDAKMDDMFTAYNEQLNKIREHALKESMSKEVEFEPNNLTDPFNQYGIVDEPNQELHGNDTFEKKDGVDSSLNSNVDENLEDLAKSFEQESISDAIKADGELTRQAVAKAKDEVIERMDRVSDIEDNHRKQEKEEEQKEEKKKEEKAEKTRKKDKKELYSKMSNLLQKYGSSSKLRTVLAVGALILWWRPIWSMIDLGFSKLIGDDWKSQVKKKTAEVAPGAYNAISRGAEWVNNLLSPFRESGDMFNSLYGKNRLGLPSDEYSLAMAGALREDWDMSHTGISPTDASAMVAAGMNPNDALLIQNYAKSPATKKATISFLDPVSGASMILTDKLIEMIYNTYKAARVDLSRWPTLEEFKDQGMHPEHNIEYADATNDNYADFHTRAYASVYAEEYGNAQYVLNHDADLAAKYGTGDEGIRAYMKAMGSRRYIPDGTNVSLEDQYDRPMDEVMQNEETYWNDRHNKEVNKRDHPYVVAPEEQSATVINNSPVNLNQVTNITIVSNANKGITD